MRAAVVALALLPALALAAPPPAAEETLMQSRCQVCHDLRYVAQQRLTEPQWKKTLEKMVKFGAVLTPEELAGLVAFLAPRYPPDRADEAPARVAPPAGALPPRAAGRKR